MAHLPRKTRLTIEALEAREVPAALAAGTELAIDRQAYDPTHVLVKWHDRTAHTTPVTAAAEALGGGTFRLSLSSSASVASALNYFRGRAGVDFAQPDYKVQVTRLPNDPSFGTLWGLNNTGQSGGTAAADIGTAGAWNYNTGSGNTVVAVIDTGVDYRHPDLAANIWHNPGEVAGNGRDDDRDGFTDDVYGWNFVNNSPNVMDDNGHGTHVSGTIGAVGDNGIGVAGINWHVKIMALKFLDRDGSGYMSNAVKALNYAVAHGAKVVNNSYGGGGSDPAMAAAIDNARAHGVIFVAAAGNDGTNNDTSPVYPANYSANNVVTVAATDRNDRLASFSNYGRTTVDLAAPGVSILSTLPGNRYGVYSGTSMATPHVVGALALVWDAHPTWTYRQVIDAVLNTTHPLASLRGKVATGGRLDVLKAITYGGAPATAGPNVTAVTFPGTGATISSARVTFSETMDPATFTAADLTFTGPNNQAIRVTGVTAIAGSSHQQFDIAFATQTVAGSYRLKIGADVRNTAGHQLDQNGNGVAGEATDTFTATTTVATIRTFASTNVGQIIADFGRVVSSINITQGIAIRDLNVRLAISHSYVGDLKVTLIGPDGTRVVLTNRRGGSGNDFGNTTFDDEAGQSIGQGTAPFAGSFRPESSLSTFNGKNARGLWQLVVEDKALFDTGRLTSWSLTFDDTGVRSRGIAEPAATTASALKEPAFDATGLFARGDGPAHHSAVEAPTGPRDESRLSELSARPAIAAAPAAWVGQQPAMAWHAENWFWEE